MEFELELEFEFELIDWKCSHDLKQQNKNAYGKYQCSGEYYTKIFLKDSGVGTFYGYFCNLPCDWFEHTIKLIVEVENRELMGWVRISAVKSA